MRFNVTRTSAYGDEMKPCPEAELGKVPVWDRRTFKTPEEHDARFPGRPWFSDGTDHTTWRDGDRYGIARRCPDEDGWYVEIADLEALIDFVAAHGEVVVTSDSITGIAKIEIYDDYRE